MDNAVQRIAIGVVALVFAGAMISFWYTKQRVTQAQYVVGLVYPATLAFHEQVNNELKKIVGLDKRFKIKEFTIAGRDQLLATNICSSALDEEVDIFVCTGLMCSQTMVKLSQKRNILKPVVFLGVHNPIDLGLIDSIEKPGHNATGLFVEVAVQQLNPIELLFLLKPNAKNILLPYAVNEHLNDEVFRNMNKSCKARGARLNLLPIDSLVETLSRVNGKIQGNDVLMYVEPDAISSYGAGMGKLASQHGISMFASSPDGIFDAALSYSSDSRIFAPYAFELVKRILINHESPANIPAQLMDGNRNLIINKSLCLQQDLKNIDIDRIVSIINTDPQFAVVRNHIVIQ